MVLPCRTWHCWRLRRGWGCALGQQTAGDSVLPQLLGVRHLPAQHAWLVPQLSWPVGPADRQNQLLTTASQQARSADMLG